MTEDKEKKVPLNHTPSAPPEALTDYNRPENPLFTKIKEALKRDKN